MVRYLSTSHTTLTILFCKPGIDGVNQSRAPIPTAREPKAPKATQLFNADVPLEELLKLLSGVDGIFVDAPGHGGDLVVVTTILSRFIGDVQQPYHLHT